MISSLIFTGFLSAFAIGPASFNIIRNLITRKSWPWQSIAGFITGDLIYMSLALFSLKFSVVQAPLARIILTLLTITSLVIYSCRILIFQRSAPQLEALPDAGQSYKNSLLLTLSNFHLLLIYAGIFINLFPKSASPFLGVAVYFCTFLLTFLGLLTGLQIFQNSLKQNLRKIEVVAAYGFLSFSFYLSMELL